MTENSPRAKSDGVNGAVDADNSVGDPRIWPRAWLIKDERGVK